MRLDDQYWVRFDVLPEITVNDPLVMTLIKQCKALQDTFPFSRIRLNDNKLRFEYPDNKIFQIDFMNNSQDPSVSYNVNKNDSWLRSQIVDYISPIITTVQLLYTTKSITNINVIPV